MWWWWAGEMGECTRVVAGNYLVGRCVGVVAWWRGGGVVAGYRWGENAGYQGVLVVAVRCVWVGGVV